MLPEGDPTTEALRAGLQALAGCAGGAATGNCTSGALGAASSVVLTNLFELVTTQRGSSLTQEQKDALTGLVGIVTAGTTTALGENAAAASLAAKIEAENNAENHGGISFTYAYTNPADVNVANRGKGPAGIISVLLACDENRDCAVMVTRTAGLGVGGNSGVTLGVGASDTKTIWDMQGSSSAFAFGRAFDGIQFSGSVTTGTNIDNSPTKGLDIAAGGGLGGYFFSGQTDVVYFRYIGNISKLEGDLPPNFAEQMMERFGSP